jgi:hypothetical protein
METKKLSIDLSKPEKKPKPEKIKEIVPKTPKKRVVTGTDKWIESIEPEEQIRFIEQILGVLKDGYRTNFLLNILTLIDIGVWKNKFMKDLIEIINDYVEEHYDKNRLLLSPNPLMSISLAAELLTKIGDNRRKFENECNRIQGRLLELGRRYSAKIEDEKYYDKDDEAPRQVTIGSKQTMTQ